MSDELRELGAALDEDGYERLAEAHPAIARGVSDAICGGQSVGSIHAYVLHCTGSPEMARWCQQAARHLLAQRGP